MTGYARAEAFERVFGDPTDGSRVFSHQRCLAHDERDEYPEETCAALDDAGLCAHYVPEAHGGELRAYDEMLAILRTVARRDLTVAIGHAKTYLGSVAVWVAGSDAQRRRTAARILDRQQIALALTERAHGSDLLASDVSARRAPGGGYVLRGQKWLVNNATRSRAMTVFARTEEAGGARGFSLFLVEKDAIERASYAHHPKILTHGIRGADISGIRFEDARVPDDAVIGGLGAGLEVMLKGLQVTRTMCSGLSLGGADHALRIAVGFALERTLYRGAVFGLPHARAALVDAFADLLLADATAIATARALQSAPSQMSTRSAVAKYVVPTLCDRAIASSALVLGARHYLRQDYARGAFQKVMRDAALVSLFDGSSIVNLASICLQLRQLGTRALADVGAEAGRAREARLRATFDLGEPLAPFAPGLLSLVSHGEDDVIASLPLAARALDAIAREPGDQQAVAAEAHRLLAALRGELAADVARIAAAPPVRASHTALPVHFELAKRYAAVHAAACCVHLWTHNRTTMTPFFARGTWVALCLRRALELFDATLAMQPRPFDDECAEALRDLVTDHRMLSTAPFALA